MKYEKKDIPQFQQDVCLKWCSLEGRCIKKNETKEHFLGCPLYFDWKLGLGPNFIIKQRIWEKEHPEEVAKKRQKNLELAKQIRAEKRKLKQQKKNE